MKNTRLVDFIVSVSVVVFCFIGLTGCATIVKGPTQEISFTSEPAGASVVMGGRILGQTPFTLLLKKKSNQTITFEKDGYKTQSLALTTRLDSWFWGNILFGGAVGSTTDGVSGSVTEYSPTQFFVTLSPISSGIVQPVSKKAEVKTFIVTAYKNILTELHSDTGEYVNSLFAILKIPTSDQEQARKKIIQLSRQGLSIPEFAEQISNLYIE